MEGHRQGPAGPQAPAGPHRAGHRARGDLHLGDAGAHRHPAQHLHHPVRPHLPARRLRGPGQGRLHRQHGGGGAVRKPIPESIAGRGPARARGGLRRGHGERLRPVRGPRRQGGHHRGRADHRPLLRPRPAALRSLLVRRGTPRPPRTRWSWTPGTATKYHFQRGRPGPGPAGRAAPDLHHLGHRRVRHGQQPGRGHPGRLRPAHGPAALRRGPGQLRRHRRADPARGGQGQPSSAPSPACSRPGSRW